MVQLIDIIKLRLNSKIKKFSYSFICGKGYSPPSGENSFLSAVRGLLTRRQPFFHVLESTAFLKGFFAQADETPKRMSEEINSQTSALRSYSKAFRTSLPSSCIHFTLQQLLKRRASSLSSFLYFFTRLGK